MRFKASGSDPGGFKRVPAKDSTTLRSIMTASGEYSVLVLCFAKLARLFQFQAMTFIPFANIEILRMERIVGRSSVVRETVTELAPWAWMVSSALVSGFVKSRISGVV